MIATATAELDYLRAEIEKTWDQVYALERVAHLIALRTDWDPLRAELGLRRIADEEWGRERRIYIRAADLIAEAIGERMARERAEREQMWQELERLRQTQAQDGGVQ